MAKKVKRRPMAEINVVPYIDVMLVLLAIFMISTPLLTQGVKVDLPQQSTEVLELEQSDTIIAKVNKKGEPYSEKEIKKKKPVLFGGYPWDVDKKNVILEKVADLEPQIVWEYTKNNTLKKENFDMTDAYTCVRAVMCRDGFWDCRKKVGAVV